jgi:hypothetical protein
MSTARRLAAILAVDFMGCSRLMDEAVTALSTSHARQPVR